MRDACQAFDALIARAAQLTSDEAARLAAHLVGCASCRELARAMKPVNDSAFAATLTPEAKLQLTATYSTETAELPSATARSDLAENPRYRITGEVGRGALGRVMHALDQLLDRPVAVKELFSTSASMRRRFMREALITARLQHPSIVPIYDAGHLGDRSPFYAMKLVAGHPLDKSIEEARTLAERLALLPTVLDVADAIAYAHSQRIIHRDLKPANVLVGKYGETIVIDWGLAKDLSGDDPDALDAGPYRAASLDHTVAGSVMGTPAYMSPEQAAGDPVDERADVYALGAILYHVVAGTAPHEGDTLEAVVKRVIGGEVRRLTGREPGVPRDLAAIVNKAMTLEPAERYASAQGLADDLRRLLTGQLVASHSYGARELLRRWLKRHRGAVSVGLAAFVVLAVVGVVSIRRIVQARRQADDAAAVAIKERSIAQEENANLLVEQGRQELLAGRSARAAVYLSQAHVQRRNPDVALRTLLADAMHSVDAQRRSLEGHTDELTAAAFSEDGKWIVTAGEDRIAKLWDSATGTVVATLSGHERGIKSASFSPDGSRVVTASSDETARLWDARTGKALATLDLAEEDHSDHVRWAGFSPDGARLVTFGESSVAKLWDAATGQLIASFTGHRDHVYAAAFSADGTRVVTASADHTAKIWDVKTAKVLHTLDGHRAEVIAAGFSPDGSHVVTASDDATARIWNARTGALVASLAGHKAGVLRAAYSRDGTRVVTASEDHSAKLWDATTGKLLVSLDGHTGEVHSAELSPDGTRVVTASYDHTAKLWDAHAGMLLASFDGHRDDVRAATFSPDGTQILTASTDGTAKLWDATPRQVRVPLEVGARTLASGALSPDGAKLAAIVEGEHTAKLWDTRSGKLVAALEGHRGDVAWVAFDATSTRVVTASADHTARLWDANTGTLLVSLDHGEPVRTAAFSADGTRVVTYGAEQRAWIWNAKNGALIVKLERTGGEYPVGVSKDATRVITAGMFGTVKIRNADGGSSVAELDGNATPVYAAAFSVDERVATASIDRTMKVWNARTGKLVASLEGRTGYVHLVSFSADGARLLTASDDDVVKLWDARTGKLLASYEGHTSDVVGAVFSPDGGRVLTASADHTARLWDERSGKLLASFDGHADAVLDAGFSADGTRVVTANRDGSIWISDVHLEQRTPDAIGSIVKARVPWTLSNGVMVPSSGGHQ
jgi:WD40 repeat protein